MKYEEFDDVVYEMIVELLKMSTEKYQEIKMVLMAQTSDNENLHNFILKVFDYTDVRRHKEICMNN